MPGWLELPLLYLTIFATLFFVVWVLARDKLSHRAQVLGWTAIAIVMASVLWSMWYESLLPYIRAGRSRAVLSTVLEMLTLFSGVGLALYGLIRFLRQWLRFLEADYVPGIRHIWSEYSPGERFRLAGKLIFEVATLPGLGLVLLGIGIAILNNFFSVGLEVNKPLMLLGTGLAFFGALLELFAIRKQRVQQGPGKPPGV